jgi:hypothetical protein
MLRAVLDEGVLIANLPHSVTASLLKFLPGLSFRTAVLAMAESVDLLPIVLCGNYELR